MSHPSVTALPFPSSWRALQIFTSYRMLLSLSLLFIFKLDLDVLFLGVKNPELYYTTALFFSFCALISFLLSLLLKRYYYLQLESMVVLDIFFILMMMHASGGATSGLGVLIAVSTSAASILTGSPAALSFSVLASFGVLAEELYTSLTNTQEQSGMTQVGVLSVTFMATSLMAYYLAKRIIESEHAAEESQKGLESMEKLNEEIIQFMSTGIIVVNGSNGIRLINRSAWIHLGMPESTQSERLETISKVLARQLRSWRHKKNYHAKAFRNTPTGAKLQASFSAIGSSKENAIIYLENRTELNQKAQNLKLASLGRLTASIAHEIRNPLGALSHAAQLMGESEQLDPDNAGLVEIIEKNTMRVNNIIENIMALSQRKTAQIKQINLSDYLPKFLQDYMTGKEDATKIELHSHSREQLILFDHSQLSQVLVNLVDNAAHYSKKKTGQTFVQIMVGIEPHSHTAFLDVIDKGKGIPPGIAERIFEPFYTTSRTGTGLGLYLSKEICEANSARLDYIPITSGGSCFRISFSSSVASSG